MRKAFQNMGEKKKKDKKSKQPAVRRTSIGGQAVLEGVMMKGARSMATAVRAPGGEITIESRYVKSAKDRNVFFRLPFVRGVVNLVTQLFQGTGIILRSAEVYGDFAEPSKTDKAVAKKFKIDPMNILMTFSVILGIVLAVGLFVLLPNVFASLISDHTAVGTSSLSSLWYSLIESGFMLVIFVCYILLVTLMKDVRRVFMYHGAEHKTISCYEHGLELTVENARGMSRQHSRCGTTFLFFVLVVSIIVFALVNFMLDRCGLLVAETVGGYKVFNALIKLAFKLLFVPVVAGISYELLKLLAKSDCLFVRILRAPGMALQMLTTKEPDDDMLEVAIAAFKRVQQMDEDPNLPETNFEIRIPLEMAKERLKQAAPSADDADIEWIIADVTETLRSAPPEYLDKPHMEMALAVADKMKDGMPLQYAQGYTEFYGIRLSVNGSVLIPRPETEELAEKAIEEIKARAEKGEATRALDLCTGSGAIAIAIAKNTAAEVVASDVSAAAIEVAKANAVNAGVKVTCLTGDMWAPVEGKFDVIVSNPPYIPSGDIAGLEDKVKKFEPVSALDGGKDGLDFYRRIRDGFEARLSEGGALFLELGIGQAESIKELFDGFDVTIFNDLEGVERIARITRK